MSPPPFVPCLKDFRFTITTFPFLSFDEVNNTKMAPKSNIALLTEGAGYIQRAKKARQDQVESVKFDDAARA